MLYKVPDLNKIRMLSAGTVTRWDRGANMFSQTIHPASDFGADLPITDGESVVCHCLNGGDVFLALATRLDCDWIALDIRQSSVDHVKKKVEDYRFRAESLGDNAYEDEYYKSGDREKAGEIKKQVCCDLEKPLFRDGEILKTRNIRYLAGDDNYLGLPEKSVDWHFSYEPITLWSPTVLIEMLASAKKGAIFAFSKDNVPSANSLREPEDGDFGVMYKTALAYGAEVDIFHKLEKALDGKEQEIGYAVIQSDSDLPVIDRRVIGYCAENIFPVHTPDGGITGFEVNMLPKGPYSLDMEDAERMLGLSRERLSDSLGRINRLMYIENCNCMYSFATIPGRG